MTNLWKKTKGWRLPLLGVIGFSFALFTVLDRKDAPLKEPLVMPPASIHQSSIAGLGVVEPKSEIISIGTELPGVIRGVYVVVGDKVSKGDLLFSIDQREIDARISSLKATLGSTKVISSDAESQFKLVEDISDKRAISRDDYNRRKYAAELGKARINEIEAQLNEAKITKERMSIRAPIDGTILDINIRSGEFASSGILSEPLIRMGDLSTYHVRVEFDEENLAKLSPDAIAKAYKRGDTTKTYPLSFVRFEPYVSPKQNLASAGQRVDTRVLQVIYSLQNDSEMFVGQQMDVFVEQRKGLK